MGGLGVTPSGNIGADNVAIFESVSHTQSVASCVNIAWADNPCYDLNHSRNHKACLEN